LSAKLQSIFNIRVRKMTTNCKLNASARHRIRGQMKVATAVTEVDIFVEQSRTGVTSVVTSLSRDDVTSRQTTHAHTEPV